MIEILSPGERSDVFRDGPPDSRLTAEFLATQCEIIRSSGCLAKVVTSLNLPKQWQLADDEEVMARLKSRLRTQVLPGTRLVRVTAWSPKSEEARHLAMEVVRAYRETRQLDSENASRAELEALKEQIRVQEDTVEMRRKLLAQIGRVKGIPCYPGPEQPGAPPEIQLTEEMLRQRVTESFNRFDYSEAKRGFEMEVELLTRMQRERLEGEARLSRPNQVCIVREDPVAAGLPARPNVPKIIRKAAGGGLLLALLSVVPLACLLEGFSLCRCRKRIMAKAGLTITPSAEKDEANG